MAVLATGLLWNSRTNPRVTQKFCPFNSEVPLTASVKVTYRRIDLGNPLWALLGLFICMQIKQSKGILGVPHRVQLLVSGRPQWRRGCCLCDTGQGYWEVTDRLQDQSHLHFGHALKNSKRKKRMEISLMCDMEVLDGSGTLLAEEWDEGHNGDENCKLHHLLLNIYHILYIYSVYNIYIYCILYSNCKQD